MRREANGVKMARMAGHEAGRDAKLPRTLPTASASPNETTKCEFIMFMQKSRVRYVPSLSG